MLVDLLLSECGLGAVLLQCVSCTVPVLTVVKVSSKGSSALIAEARV